MERVKKQLKRRQPLLPIDNRPLLHQPRWSLNLLQYNGAEEMRVMLIVRLLQEPLGHTDDVIPDRLPLVLFIPDVGSLEQRDNKPLRLHEHHLRRSDLSLQRLLSSSALYGEGAAVPPSTSTNSATTWSWPSSAPVRMIGAKSGLTGFRVIRAWRQLSPSLVISLS